MSFKCYVFNCVLILWPHQETRVTVSTCSQLSILNRTGGKSVAALNVPICVTSLTDVIIVLKSRSSQSILAAPTDDFIYDWAEPSGEIKDIDPKVRALVRELSFERLEALRNVMSAQTPPIDAYIIPTADAHNSQYIAPTDARREWISGLTGSSGTAIVTKDLALVWTDGRYFTQFENEVDDTYWILMRQGIDATITVWLTTNLSSGNIVGIDPTTYTRSAWIPLNNALQQAGIQLRAITENLVDSSRRAINDPPPARPNKALIPLSVEFTGRRASDKISELRQRINSNGAAALVLTALDDIAYTLNVRGQDIPYNPVFFSYLIIRPETAANNIVLFWGEDAELADDISVHFSDEGINVEVRRYDEIFTYLSSTLPSGSLIWLSQDGSEAIHLAAEGGNIRTLSTLSPVALIKCIKNEVELEGFRNSHIKDGLAVVRFLKWLHQEVESGTEVTEIQASDKLIEFRSEEDDFMGPSFATIAGAGANGAIIHYKPSSIGEQTVIKQDDMFLVDSGGQYRDGTTDITRTRHMNSSPTDRQKMAFTRVLKGQIMLATAVFPKGSMGNILDILARKGLFDVGLNYAHGTGHGVGHFLNVHEGPSGIGSGATANDPGIEPGMIFSNEPGFYEVGEYGIRHEDLVEVIEMTEDADHIFANSLAGNFDESGAIGFYTISLAPHQTACIDVDLLTDDELNYINNYHSRVLQTLGPILQERGLDEEYNWLVEECAPLRSYGNVIKPTTILVFMYIAIKMF